MPTEKQLDINLESEVEFNSPSTYLPMANEPTIAEMNKAIAEFMGAKDTGNGFVEIPGRTYSLSSRNYPRSLRYNLYWDWLMPVVEKAMSLTVKSTASYNPDRIFRIEIVNGYTQIEGTGERIFFNSSIEGSMLMATYKAVYQFIQWYNQQKQKDGEE